jgi:uncharacterized membrane protein YcfT
MPKLYHVRLTKHDVNDIKKVLGNEEIPMYIRKRCNILLLANETAGKALSQEKIALQCNVSHVTVYHTVKDYATEGIERCLRRR